MSDANYGRDGSAESGLASCQNDNRFVCGRLDSRKLTAAGQSVSGTICVRVRVSLTGPLCLCGPVRITSRPLFLSPIGPCGGREMSNDRPAAGDLALEAPAPLCLSRDDSIYIWQILIAADRIVSRRRCRREAN